MTFDYEGLAKRYKKSPADVKAKIDEYKAKIKSELKDFYGPDTIDEEVEKLVSNNLGKLFVLKGLAYAQDQYATGSVKKANVIVIGVSPPEDGNSYNKWLATNEYWNNPRKEVIDGLIVMHGKDGKIHAVREGVSSKGNKYPIAVYGEPVIRKKNADGTFTESPNPDYGKDIPTKLKANVPIIVSGWTNTFDGKEATEAVEEFKMGSMPWADDLVNHPDIGKKSTVYCKPNGEYLTILKDAYEGNEIYTKAYDVAMRVLPTTEFWMDLATVNDQPIIEITDGKRKNIYTKFATKGQVQRIEIQDLKDKSGNSYQKAKLRISDTDVVNGINLGTSYSPIVAYISEHVTKDDEVIVFGCKKSFTPKDKDGKDEIDPDGNKVKRPYYELWGVLRSFDSAHDKMLQRLKERGLI